MCVCRFLLGAKSSFSIETLYDSGFCPFLEQFLFSPDCILFQINILFLDAFLIPTSQTQTSVFDVPAL